MALMEINTAPLGTGTTSVGDFIAEMQKILATKGLPFMLTDMGTVVEGSMEELLDVIRDLHESPFSRGAQRVYTVVKIDDRRDKVVHLGQKVQSVQERLK